MVKVRARDGEKAKRQGEKSAGVDCRMLDTLRLCGSGGDGDLLRSAPV